jgi:hypothetical protein
MVRLRLTVSTSKLKQNPQFICRNLKSLGLNSARQGRYIDPFHSYVMIGQHALKVAGQRGCCNAIGCAIGNSGLYAKVMLKPAHWKTFICGLRSLSFSRKLTPAAPAPAAHLRLLAYSPYCWTVASADVSLQHLIVDVFTYYVQLSHVHCPVVGPSWRRSKRMN